MSFFNELRNFNSNLNDVSNSEKAKNLRKKAITIGSILTGIGILGVITCFTLFGVLGFTSVGGGQMFNPGMIVSMVLIIPFGFVLSAGTVILRLGLGVAVTGYTSNLIDETVGSRCPKCGDIIEVNEIFCSHCGTKLKKECPKCGTVNNAKNNYCEKCGSELE